MNAQDLDQALTYLKKQINITNLFWLIYLALLGVLLPHTAWAFNRFQEGTEQNISWMAWSLAGVFELAVFAFTHMIKSRIEKSHRLRQKEVEQWLEFAWRRFATAYLNIFGLGLLFTSGVSALANFAYAVEFARFFAIYTEYSFPPLLYELAFGGILPIVSFLFARILAESVNAEDDRDEALEAAKRAEREARRSEERLRRELEDVRKRFAEFETLYAEQARERILAAKRLWPNIPNSGIAVIADTSAGYVSDVLNSMNGKSS